MKNTLLILLIGIIAVFLTACPEIRTQEESRKHCLNLQKENIFWRVMRGENLQTISTPEESLGVIVFMLLAINAENINIELRQIALDSFHGKSGFYLNEEERIETVRTLAVSESPGERLNTIKRMLEMDRRALDFLDRVLNDEERMTAFLRGDEIPLHKIPPCCASYL